MTHKTFIPLFLSLFLLLASCGQTPPPVNPNASPEVKELLKLLYDVSGKQVISGQHNYARELNRSTDSTVAITGKTPLIWGAEIGRAHV